MQKAVVIAVAHINRAGGPLGREIELHRRDSERRPASGVAAYEDLVAAEDIVGFVGAASSKVSIPIARRIGEDRVMQVSCLSASPELTTMGYADGRKYFARTVAPSNSQARYFTPAGFSDPELWSEHEQSIEGFAASAAAPTETLGAQRFRSAMGEPVPPFTPHAYDAMFLMALAIERAGEATGSAIADNIRAVSRPPGHPITVNDFDTARRLLQDGESIDYRGASGAVDLIASLEPRHAYR